MNKNRIEGGAFADEWPTTHEIHNPSSGCGVDPAVMQGRRTRLPREVCMVSARTDWASRKVSRTPCRSQH